MNPMSLFLPLAGGILIGLSAGLLLLLSGKIAGISGIVDGAFSRNAGHRTWRVAFIAGLLAGGAGIAVMSPSSLPFDLNRPLPYLAAAGLLVGAGSRLGSGCTSGHGVCGMGRLSVRSMVSVATFTAIAAVTVYVVRHALGSAS
jgi:hypothetical protein